MPVVGSSARDIAVDLGTTTTVIYARGRGIVLVEPSLLAVDSTTGTIRAAGIDAERLLRGSDRSVIAARPLRHGMIADIELASDMLRRFIRTVCGGRWARPRLVVSVPSGATGIERSALREACVAAGARSVCVIEKPLAAAIGAGLPVREGAASLLLDVGGGTSEAAVVSLGEIVVWRSIRIGSEELDQTLIKHLKREHNLLIDERTAEEVKRQIGSGSTNDTPARIDIRGRDMRSARPVAVAMSGEEIRGVFERPVAQIIETVKDTLARTPPQLGSDVIDRGVTLAGGGSLLRGLEERLREETQIPAQLAELPLTCVAAGSGTCLEQIEAGQLRDEDIAHLAP